MTPLKQTNKHLSSVQFKCDAAGSPISSTTWLHDGRPLDPDAIKAGRVSVEQQHQGRRSVIRVKNLTLEDQGSYQCMVLGRRRTNLAGQLQLPPIDSAQATAGLALSSMPPTLRATSQPHIVQVSSVLYTNMT